MLYFRLSTFFWFVLSLFICIFLYCFVCQLGPLSVKWLHAKTTSEMTYTVSSGALNSTPTNLSDEIRMDWDHFHRERQMHGERVVI